MKLPKTFADDKRSVHAIIETPAGNRCKYAYDPATGLYKLSKVLPAGTVFPWDMGFIPRSKGGDGDPLDVLLLLEMPAYPGCLFEARIIGVIEASQQEGKEKPKRNDRFLAVAKESKQHAHIRSVTDLREGTVEELVRFFEFYTSAEKIKFTVLNIGGPQRALKLIQKYS